MALYERLSEYLNAAHEPNPNPEKLMDLSRTIGSFGGHQSLLFETKAAQEVAAKFPDYFREQRNGQEHDGSALLFSRTGAVALQLATNDMAKPSVRLSALLVAADTPLKFPLTRATMTDSTLVENHHEQMLRYLPQVLNSWDVVKKNNDQEKKDYKGLMSEIAVRMLLQRYGILKIGCDEWQPVSSYLSEDYGRLQGDGRRRGWDITIFSNANVNNEPKEVNYIQVKSSDFELKPYTDNIDTVYVNKLKIKPIGTAAYNFDNEAYPQQILRELIVEQGINGARTAKNALDARTENLFAFLS